MLSFLKTHLLATLKQTDFLGFCLVILKYEMLFKKIKISSFTSNKEQPSAGTYQYPAGHTQAVDYFMELNHLKCTSTPVILVEV